MLDCTAFQTNSFFLCHNPSKHILHRTCLRTSLNLRPRLPPLISITCRDQQVSPSSSQNPPSLSRGTNRTRITPLKKPYGYWKQTANILRELRAYMASSESIDKSVMPTRTQLKQASRNDLAGAISRAGWSNVAEAANLPLSSIARPRSLNLVFATQLRLTTGCMRPYMYWRDFSHVRDELFQAMRQLNVNHLPSARCLIQAGRSDLARAIRIHGGWRAVASRMGVQCASDRPVTERNRDQSILLREYVADELKRATHDAGRSSDDLPITTKLNSSGKRSILADIQAQFGGWNKVKEYVNSKDTSHVSFGTRTQKLKELICVHVLECISAACSEDWDLGPGEMPRKTDLMTLGRNDLVRLVDKVGSIQVAHLCGLHGTQQ